MSSYIVRDLNHLYIIHELPVEARDVTVNVVHILDQSYTSENSFERLKSLILIVTLYRFCPFKCVIIAIIANKIKHRIPKHLIQNILAMYLAALDKHRVVFSKAGTFDSLLLYNHKTVSCKSTEEYNTVHLSNWTNDQDRNKYVLLPLCGFYTLLNKCVVIDDDK